MSTTKLSMLDDFGDRKMIIPAEVKGRFRRWRYLVHFILLVLFLGLPWISVNGTQTILLDIPNRHFELFGHIFLSHDSPLIFFIFALFALTITLTTALWGRIWCGWACPQTVFIDFIYRQIEFYVEGHYRERRRLYQSPMTREKLIKLSFKWILFFIVSSIFAHSFIAYFVGRESLLEMMRGSPQENWTYFLIVSGVTSLLLFNFGWFREQFCIIMCPYGRFQSVLMDPHSLSVYYDSQRGEPRKGALVQEGSKSGDCVSCQRCVQVCPTGIDIRDGLQMECIGCTACIDACDEIMTKVKKPTGLISYKTAVPPQEHRYFRPRIIIYLLCIMLASLGLTYNLATRKPFFVSILRGSEAPYQRSPDGSIINHFKLNFHNQSHSTQFFEISLPLTNSQSEVMKLISPQSQYELPVAKSKEIHIFISFPPSQLDKRGILPLRIRIFELSSQTEYWIEANGVGPIL